MFCLVQLQPAWARLDTGGQVFGVKKGRSTADSDPRLLYDSTIAIGNNLLGKASGSRNYRVCVSMFGEVKSLPENPSETFISEPPHALKNLGLGAGIPRLFST